MAVARAVLWGFTGVCLVLAGAACSGHPEVVNTSVQDPSEYSPEARVLIAAADGDLDTVRQLIEAEPRFIPYFNMSQSKTPLHFAAHGDHYAVVQYLLEKGSDPTALDQEGMTPQDVARSRQASARTLDLLRQAETRVSGR